MPASTPLETPLISPLHWMGDPITGHLELLDQRRLPTREIWLPMHSARDVARAIDEMVIRGAPAIGIAAAFGVALDIRNYADDPMISLEAEAQRILEQLADTRPTAVNLTWALHKCRALIADFEGDLHHLTRRLFDLAQAILEADRDNNRSLGQHGASLFDRPVQILTHCNAGALATGGYGTALGVVRSLHAAGHLQHLWIDETRPYLQGSRLTAWECAKDQLPATLITDNMAAHFMKAGAVDAIIVGADRVAQNGDVANKIGTYALAILAHHHNIPFYVASPRSTFDLDTPSGEQIPIEERSAQEITHIGESPIAPKDFPVAHPAFDITPADLITAIITETGVIHPPYPAYIPSILSA